jgi:DNA-binding transcriptional regulator LsrR (DeoR family)
MEKASSLIEPSAQKRGPDIEKLKRKLSGYGDIKERNELIVKAYEQGYSQHMIAKVLGISQPAVHGVIKRRGK